MLKPGAEESSVIHRNKVTKGMIIRVIKAFLHLNRVQVLLVPASPSVGWQDQTLLQRDASRCSVRACRPLVRAALQSFRSEARLCQFWFTELEAGRISTLPVSSCSLEKSW